MNSIYAVIDKARDCNINISLDEVFFAEENFIPIIRFYTWTKPSFTIGYFQKISQLNNPNQYDVVRRLTGGLAVLHEHDLSYSFIVSDNEWDYIYDQEETYKIIHTQMKNALLCIGIKCDDNMANNLNENKFSCVNTFYKDDIFLNGRKLIGSCQRRRGKKILVEGSIHLKMTQEQIELFANAFFENISKFLHGNVTKTQLSNNSIDKANKLSEEKYNTLNWKNLF